MQPRHRIVLRASLWPMASNRRGSRLSGVLLIVKGWKAALPWLKKWNKRSGVMHHCHHVVPNQFSSNALCGIVFVLYLFLWQLEVNMKSTKSIKMTRFSAKYHLQKSVALTSCKLVQVYGAKPFIIVATTPGPFHESPRYSQARKWNNVRWNTMKQRSSICLGLRDCDNYDFCNNSCHFTSVPFHMFGNLVEAGAAQNVGLNGKYSQPPLGFLGKERQRSDLWWRQTAANAFVLHCFTCPVWKWKRGISRHNVVFSKMFPLILLPFLTEPRGATFLTPVDALNFIVFNQMPVTPVVVVSWSIILIGVFFFPGILHFVTLLGVMPCRTIFPNAKVIFLSLRIIRQESVGNLKLFKPFSATFWLVGMPLQTKSSVLFLDVFLRSIHRQAHEPLLEHTTGLPFICKEEKPNVQHQQRLSALKHLLQIITFIKELVKILCVLGLCQPIVSTPKPIL